MKANDAKAKILVPNLQVSFYYKLQSIKSLFFSEALGKTLRNIDLQLCNEELSNTVPSEYISKLASFALRAEVIFPVPCILKENPYLLGYYRLLYGFSQKEFYQGYFSKFQSMEKSGQLPDRVLNDLPGLCSSLAKTGMYLIDGIDQLSITAIHELQILTVGPQFRGSENTKIGQTATKDVYDLIKEIVSKSTKSSTERTIIIENDSGRTVLIEFFSDPDIRITQELSTGEIRPLISVEIKGGSDYSNVHNRLGEAEKSHQKAKANGFFEYWTILKIKLDMAKAKQESPTTSRFFNIDLINEPGSEQYRQFREVFCSIIGIHID